MAARPKIQENVEGTLHQDSYLDAHTPQPLQCDTANQFFPECRDSILEDYRHVGNNEVKLLLRPDHNSSEVDMMQHQYGSENKKQNTKENSQQLSRQCIFGALLSVIRPHLSGDKDMHIQSLHAKYVKNEIQLVDYDRHLRNIVGDDQMYQQARCKLGVQSPLTGQNSHTASAQLHQTSLQQHNQVFSRVKSTTTSFETGNMTKKPPRKASSVRKKPKDALHNASTLTSKRQKLSGPFLDHSIESPNDVTVHSGVDLMEEEDELFSSPKEESRTSEFTERVFEEEEESECKKQVSGTVFYHGTESFGDVSAYCGINLMKEEEQLFAGLKEQSRTSEAIRQTVQEEERRLILQKLPFQKKMTNIISHYGIKNTSKDVEHCVSLCLEDRMRGLVHDCVRLSKQRVDIERLRHETVISSDVGHQILLMNQKAKMDLEKKQAEEFEVLWKSNEARENAGSYGERGKEKCHTTNLKASISEIYKIERANIAVRDSVGGDDVLAKWRLMAEKARQNCEGVDSESTLQIGCPSTAATSGIGRKFGRNPVLVPHRKIVRKVSVKDVISALEREPQMSKSTVVYRLYQKVITNAPRASADTVGASVTTH